MKRQLSAVALLCAASQLHAVTLSGNNIPQANLPGCDPYSLSDQMAPTPWLKRASPRHCATVPLLNPIFTWSRPKDVPVNTVATIRLTRLDNGVVETFTTAATRLLYPGKLTAFSTANPVTYEWTVSYPVGTTTRTSSPRKFVVAAAESLPDGLPTGAQIAQAASVRAHPRALQPGKTYVDILSAIEQGARPEEMKAALTATLVEADKFLPVMKNGSITRTYPIFVPVAGQGGSTLGEGALKERRAIELLGHMYLLTKNMPNYQEKSLRYLEECRNRLLLMAQWSDDESAPTSQKNHDQANREAFLALALGLDLFDAPDIPAAMRLHPETEAAPILARIKSRLAQARKDFALLEGDPYLSHVVSSTHYATEALMYLVGRSDFPEAGALLEEAWSTLVAYVGVWGGTSDGGFGNGTAYGWYSMTKNVRTLPAIKLITGYDLTDFAPIGKIGMNLIAQTPPADESSTTFHPQMGTFGDGTEFRNHFRDYAGIDFRLLAYATKSAQYEWYWRTYAPFVKPGAYPTTVNISKPLLPYHFLLLGMSDPIVPAPPVVQNSFLFEDAGYVAFHSDTKDANRSSLFFRSSPQGTASHAEADNNSFNFVSNGREVLISSGFYPEWKDKHFNAWTRHTRSKNALTITARDGLSALVAGVGQAQEYTSNTFTNVMHSSVEANGKLVNYYAGSPTDPWQIATGDATNAYRAYDTATGKWQPLLSNAIRTVVYYKIPGSVGEPANQGVALIYDYATSANNIPRSWELNFHTLAEPAGTADGGFMVGTAGDPLRTCVRYYGPAATRTSITAPDVPTTAEHPQVMAQYHTRWTTKAETKDFRAVTVVTEGCKAHVYLDNFSNSPSAMTVHIGTSWITFDKGQVTFSPQ